MQRACMHACMQDDWIEHCKRWSSIKDGIVRDNCYNHTEEVSCRAARPPARPCGHAMMGGAAFVKPHTHCSVLSGLAIQQLPAAAPAAALVYLPKLFAALV